MRLGHYLIPHDGFDMAAAPQRAGSLVVPSPRALEGGERSGSGAALHLSVDRELSGDVVELDRVSCSSGELYEGAALRKQGSTGRSTFLAPITTPRCFS